MKDFSNRGFRLSDSSIEVRLAYTGFLVFVFVGYLTIVLIGCLRVGPGVDEIVTHYRGSETEETFPRAFGQMLEEAHFHAFIEGLILLVLAHLFVATSVSRRIKVTVILIAYFSTLADLGSPWLIRYGAVQFAYLQMISWLLIVTSAVVLIVVPLYEMWFKENKR
jgi:hypothetical protein